MFMCYNPKCNSDKYLKLNGSDCRQEWTEEFYICSICGETYTLRTNYGIQSSIVKEQFLIRDKTGKKIK